MGQDSGLKVCIGCGMPNKIRIMELGKNFNFGHLLNFWTLRSEWVLIRGGRLFEAGRLLSFHHFQQV